MTATAYRVCRLWHRRRWCSSVRSKQAETAEVEMSDGADRGRRMRRGFERAEDRYFLVLLLIIASLLLMALAGDGVVSRAGVVILVALTLIETLRTSGWRTRSIRITIGIVVALFVICGLVASTVSDDAGTAALSGLGMALLVVAIAAIVFRLARQERITMKMVLGALCIYLYVGMLFALVFGFVDLVGHEPFFVQTDDATSLDYVYFSIVTMTTVGYGDFSAAGNLGRMLAVSEALFGQLYLVSVVAILVGNLGSAVPRREIRGGQADDGETSQND